MKGINREILKLALPSILANITVPLVGIVDTAVAGHIPAGSGFQAATFIGAISVGALLFDLIYWNFGFLRSGTGGLTAQAYGAGNFKECARIFYRGIDLSLVLAFLTLALQWPFVKLALLVVDASPEVELLAEKYFFARIWAAPATVSLMTFSGWFVGMQDSVNSMWKDLIVNLMNVVASLVLALGIGPWKGLGFIGVAWGTVVAQYSGLLFCIIICRTRYSHVLKHFRISKITEIFGKDSDIKSFFKMNVNLSLRSASFIAIYIGYTMIAAKYGDLMLACSSIMMQLLMIFSYFTDGFAYAGEAMTGKYIGARDLYMTRKTVRYIFCWSMSIAVAFIGIYYLSGVPLLHIMTSDESVVEACKAFLPWLIFMPPLGCAAFTWDGIYLGATDSESMRDSMVGSALLFILSWFIFKWIWQPSGALAIHLLLAAYFVHLIFRTVFLSLRYKRNILERPFLKD